MTAPKGEYFNLRHLRAYVAVCRNQSVSAAADDVHMSQPAVTQAVAKLEAALTVPLFVRSSKGMFPSEAGLVFEARCSRALKLLREGTLAAASRQKKRRIFPFDTMITSAQLRALIAMSEHGNFSVAARSVGIAQPSLYRTARDLEKVSGLELYRKSEQGFALSVAGQNLVKMARLAFYELNQGVEEILAWKGVDGGRLVIGSLPLLRSTVLPEAIVALSDEYPDAAITVVDGGFDDLFHALRYGELDLILGALRQPPPAPDVVQVPLFSDRLGVFCHPDHPFVGQGEIEPARLSQSPWVVGRKGTPTRHQFARFFADRGMAEPKHVVETGSLILMRGLLRDRTRLSMISQSQVRDEVAQGTLVPLPIEIGDTPREIGFTHRTIWRPTRLQSRFIDLLKEDAKRMQGAAPYI